MPLPSATDYQSAPLSERVQIAQRWLDAIEAKGRDVGLIYGDPIEFEFTTDEYIFGYGAKGMPHRYEHWRLGKHEELLRLRYKYGLGRIHELVMNTRPYYAYLLVSDPLYHAVLVMSHVCGHVDFFANNQIFRSSGIDPFRAVQMFRAHEELVRGYIGDPGIGLDAVEGWLDAVHALENHSCRSRAVSWKTPEEAYQEELRVWRVKHGKYDILVPREQPPSREKFNRIPVEPAEDILAFIRDFNPNLTAWQRDLIDLVIEEMLYFHPQIQTKFMDEGWAVFMHRKIFSELCGDGVVPDDMVIGFSKFDSGVAVPHEGGLNPYHIGCGIFTDVEERYDNPRDEKYWSNWHKPCDLGHVSGTEKIFSIREIDDDASFIRTHLTPALARKLSLFRYEPQGDYYVVTDTSRDEETFERIRDTLVQGVGLGKVPVIRVTDVKRDSGELILEHAYDGRELQLDWAKKTIEYVYRLWCRRPVALRTMIGGKEKTVRIKDGTMSES